MPKPASESPDAFGSPVPAYSVPVAASKVNVPIEFVAKLPERNVQFGEFPSALLVRQTPPPAAATQSMQSPFVQVGAMASAVMRPEVMYEAPLKVKISGKFATLGPMRFHAPAERAASDFMFAHAFCASRVSLNGTSLAG